MYKRFYLNAVKKYSNIHINFGKGSYVYDMSGKKYLDFTSGIGVLGLGHQNFDVNVAIMRQMNKYTHAQQMCLYDPLITSISRSISQITPGNLNRVFFTPSGSEAVDNSIKISRMYTEKKKVLSIKRAFHGRLLSVSGLTDNNLPGKDLTRPFINQCICVDNIIDYIESPNNRNIASVIIECVQGESGIYKLDVDFVQKLSSVCKKYDILLICDEIQCGLGRTGKMFALEYFDIIPDMILIGKGISNGLPLGGVISTEQIFNKCPPGSLGGTYSGCSLSLASAIEVIKILRENQICMSVLEKSDYIKTYLNDLKQKNSDIIDVRVYGLMIGIELSYPVEQVIKNCENMGLLVLPTSNPNTIRFLPPLTISMSDIKWGLELFSQSLSNSIKDLLINNS